MNNNRSPNYSPNYSRANSPPPMRSIRPPRDYDYDRRPVRGRWDSYHG